MLHPAITLTADTSAQFLIDATAREPREQWEAMMQIGGNFGGGTLSFKVSLDGGTTKNSVKDGAGNVYTTTTADTIPFYIPYYDTKDNFVKLYAVLTGSITPSITILIGDTV